MQRRLVLALLLVAVAAALAGCADAAGSVAMSSVDDDALASEASRSLADDPDPIEAYHQRHVRAAIENGSVTDVNPRPNDDSVLPVAYEGRYYDVSSEVVDREMGYRAEFSIDYNTSSVNGSTIRYSELPAVDRRALAPLFAGPRRGDEPGFDLGLPAGYTDSEADSSVLVPDQRYAGVVYEGETYEIAVDSGERTSMSVYRYDASLVAESTDVYAAQLRERYEFTLSGLSTAERDVVDEAVDGRYYAEDTDDQGFASLVDRFLDRPAVERDRYSGSWVARYDGELYWVEMDFGSFVDDAESVTAPDVTPPDATPPPE